MYELIGLLLPPLIDLFNKNIANSLYRFWVSVLICVIIGAGMNYIETGFAYETTLDLANGLSETIMALFFLAQVSYKTIYEDSDLQATIDPRIDSGLR